MRKIVARRVSFASIDARSLRERPLRHRARIRSKKIALSGCIISSLVVWHLLARDEGFGGLRLPPEHATSDARITIGAEGLFDGMLDLSRALPAPEARAALEIAPGVTRICVRIETADGSTLRSGEVSCLASAVTRPELADKERASLQVLEIVPEQEVYSFTLAEGMSSAIVSAHVSGLRPAERWLYELRALDDRYASPEANLTWEVTLVVGAMPTAPYVFGSIAVDGCQRVPAGMVIDLVQQGPKNVRTWAEFHAGGTRRATIWDEGASFVVAPLSSRTEGLWVTSRETVPLWIPISGDESPDKLEVNLELATGFAYQIELVDKRSGQVLPGWPVDAEVNVETSRNVLSRQILYRPDTRHLTTGADGRCVIPGLPSTGYLRVSTTVASESLELFQEYLRGAWSSSQVRRVEVDLDSVPGGSLWGPVPVLAVAPASQEPPAPTVIRYRKEAAEARSGWATAELTSQGVWSLAGAPGAYTVWAESAGIRVSDYLAAEIVNGQSRGPLELQARGDTESLALEWSAAPSSEIEILLSDSSGATVERRRESFPSETGGCHLLLPSGGAGSLVTVLHGSDYRLIRQLKLDAAESAVHLDLCGDRAVPLELLVSPGAVANAEALFFRISGGPEGEQIIGSTTIRNGMSSEIPLPPGRYYVRIDGSEVKGAVCGLVERVEGSQGALVLEWSGSLTALSGDSPLPKGSAMGIEVTEISGVSLESTVPGPLRCFSAPGLTSQPTRGALIDVQRCAWTLH